MKITIDTVDARKNRISIEKYLICLAIDMCESSYNFQQHYEELFNAGMICEDDSGVHITDKAKQKIISCSKAEGAREDRKQELTDIAESIKALYPTGTKPGTASSWRGTTPTICEHLERFFKKFGEYTKDQIVRATREYIDSFNGIYDNMKTLPYFIIKNEKYFDDEGFMHYKEKSVLAERIEMLGTENKASSYFDNGELIV